MTLVVIDSISLFIPVKSQFKLSIGKIPKVFRREPEYPQPNLYEGIPEERLPQVSSFGSPTSFELRMLARPWNAVNRNSLTSLAYR